MEFIEKHFDKLLLSILMILAAIMTIILMSLKMDVQMITWSQGLTVGFSGALLGLITGSRFTPRSSDKPPNGDTK